MRPSLVGSFATNAVLALAGRDDAALYHPVGACYLVTYRCELRCAYCLENVQHRSVSGVAPELDTAGAMAVLRGIRDVVAILDVSGGEPALRDDLGELLGYARELRFEEVMLNSNGIHLLERPELLAHVHTVVLGIDTLREEPFARITKGSSQLFRRQMEALRELLRLRAKWRFDVELCTVLLADELDEIEPILDFCFEHELLLSVSPHIDRELRVDKTLRAEPRYRALASRLVTLKKRGFPLLGSVSYYEGLRELGEHRCVPMANMTVSPMGELFWPCGELQGKGPSFVEGAPYRAMVDRARTLLGPPPKCTDRCHFSCRMALSTILRHPLELAEEALFLRKYRRFRG